MHSVWQESASSPRGHKARGFTLTELMVMVAIIVVVLAVTVPSFTAISRDLELSKARSNVFASLTAARSRAIASHNMVALHIFRDSGNVYSVPRDSNNSTIAAYNQSTGALNSFRWGVNFDSATGLLAYGLPHAPTNKMTMRLEVPNPDSLHNTAATNPDKAVEFFWPADHDPIILPDSLGICRPLTPLGLATDVPPGQYVDTEIGRVKFADDFYIVFADDGKLATVLVDYNLADPANPAANTVSTALVTQTGGAIPGMGTATWSGSGLCLYDTPTYKAQPTGAAAYNYVNRADNTVTLSPYTGMPMEATR